MFEKTKRAAILCIAVCSIACASGCMTALTIAVSEEKTKCNSDCNVPRIYSGSAGDICGLTADNLGLFALIDLPLSFAADTILLPYTIYAQNKYGDISIKGPCPPESE